MLCKTFTGLTDKMPEWQTHEFKKLETSRDAYTVYLGPEIGVEIAFYEIQASYSHTGGLALRFVRVKGYRRGSPLSISLSQAHAVNPMALP